MIAKTFIPGITNSSAERLRKFSNRLVDHHGSPNVKQPYCLYDAAGRSQFPENSRLARFFSKAREAVSSNGLVLGYPIALEREIEPNTRLP
jgi:hypothetical protein